MFYLFFTIFTEFLVPLPGWSPGPILLHGLSSNLVTRWGWEATIVLGLFSLCRAIDVDRFTTERAIQESTIESQCGGNLFGTLEAPKKNGLPKELGCGCFKCDGSELLGNSSSKWNYCSFKQTRKGKNALFQEFGGDFCSIIHTDPMVYCSFSARLCRFFRAFFGPWCLAGCCWTMLNLPKEQHQLKGWGHTEDVKQR